MDNEHGFIKEVIIDEKMLDYRIKQLAENITKDYSGKQVVLICSLRGAVYFYTALSKNINLEIKEEFIRVSSYKGFESTENCEFKMFLEDDITNKDVIVVEDVVDSGRTMKCIIDYLNKQNPNSIKICTLLDKPEKKKEVDIKIDYIGFNIPNYFVVGFGLDLDEKYRNLPRLECIVSSNEEVQIVKDAKIKLEKELFKRW